MRLRANIHSMEWTYRQIYILRNGHTGKYTFYKMGLQANTHSTECAYEKIYILQNASTGKYMHFTECANGPIHIRQNKPTSLQHYGECVYRQNVAKSILFVRNQSKC